MRPEATAKTLQLEDYNKQKKKRDKISGQPNLNLSLKNSYINHAK